MVAGKPVASQVALGAPGIRRPWNIEGVPVITLVFWLWIPWDVGGPTFHETQLQFTSYKDCMSAREHMFVIAKLKYPTGTVAAGACYP